MKTAETAKIFQRKKSTFRANGKMEKSPKTAGFKQVKTKFQPKGKTQIPTKWIGYHRTLLALYDRLLNERCSLAKSTREPGDTSGTHMADIASDEFDRNLRLCLLSADQDILFEVEDALQRIDTGVYGICEITGKRIPASRLHALPWTRFSVEAERELERKGLVGKLRLGKLGSVETRPIIHYEFPEKADSQKKPSSK